MAGQVPFCIVIALQISIVLCRSDFFNQHFSRHHRGSTAPSETSSTVPPTGSSESSIYEGGIIPQHSDNWNNNGSSESSIYDGDIIPQHSDYWDNNDGSGYRITTSGNAAPSVALVIGITIFSLSMLFLCIGLVALCCRYGCCATQQRRGFVMLNNVPPPTVMQGYQHVVQPSQQMPSFPPPYHMETAQQQHFSQWQQQQQNYPIRQDFHHSTANTHPSLDTNYQRPTSPLVPCEKY